MDSIGGVLDMPKQERTITGHSYLGTSYMIYHVLNDDRCFIRLYKEDNFIDIEITKEQFETIKELGS